MSTISLLRAAAAAFLIGVSATLAVATGNGLLFPSLGPTAMSQVTSPASCSPRTVLVAHAGGVLSAVFANTLAMSTPVVVAGIAAPTLATAMTILWQALLRCEHPPAVATTLLLASGLSGAPSPLEMCIGVLLLTLFAEPVRRMFLRAGNKEVLALPV